MDLLLNRWQEKLETHFQELALAREGSGLPLFAFEHCLKAEEVENVGQLLTDHLSATQRPRVYWLLWVIYATEIGYNYTGDEYWQSFEEQTPGWEFQHRYALKKWFKKFQETYNGFEPSGQWAEHFSIIAWPITHAILPCFLQNQFAGALYQLRYRLAGLTKFDPTSVGRLLRIHSNNASTRLEKFLQQEELTGRFVACLLDNSSQVGQEPVYRPAFNRIVADLERVRRTRSWLRDTRQTVIDRFRGIGQGMGPRVHHSRNVSGGEQAKDAFNQPDLRPNLLLRYSGSGVWAVAVDIPSFSLLAMLQPGLSSFLKSTRCRVSGSADTKPSGWTLVGKRLAILKSWPNAKEPILQFEKPHSVLDGLLRVDCRISPGPNWLFRIGADGRAREIRGHNVHPGASYILASLNEISSPFAAFIKECSLECEGVHAFRISVPENLSKEHTSQLRMLGLEVARTVRVWPAGLPCRAWDGEGHSEWLTTEQPQFGIAHDHPVQSFLARLDNGAELLIEAPDPGKPVFIQLDALPVGRYCLTVTACRHSASEDDELSGYVELKVREPEPWTPGVPAHMGLIVSVDPYDANLDELWTNKVDVSISGPESHTVKCVLSLRNRQGAQILSNQVGGNLRLPVAPSDWRQKLESIVNRDANEWKFLEASSGLLKINGEELGNCQFRFERDTLPIRWVARHVSRNVILKLIDDTGQGTSGATCKFYSMENPSQARTFSASIMMKGIRPQMPGGLYVAQQGLHGDALALSCGLSGKGWEGLGVSSDCTDVLNGNISVAAALRVLAIWRSARLAGPLSEIRRNGIVKQLIASIFAKLCGTNWSRAEEAFKELPTDPNTREGLHKTVGRNKEFNTEIQMRACQFGGAIEEVVQWYAEIARRYGVCSELNFCEFAVILAQTPHTLAAKYSDGLDAFVKMAASNPEVLRGARYASLLNSSGNDLSDSIDVFRRRQL